MGACYSVYAKLKIKDNMEEEIVRILNKKIERADEENVDYNIEGHNPEFVKPYNLEELLATFFVEHQGNYTYKRLNNTIEVDSGFNASYGWHLVMYQAMKLIAPYLKNGSVLEIYDDDNAKYRVKDGELK